MERAADALAAGRTLQHMRVLKLSETSSPTALSAACLGSSREVLKLGRRCSTRSGDQRGQKTCHCR